MIDQPITAAAAASAAPEADTAERILRAASTLFASKGYFGTSTREIAGLVEVRQPSLFHHFSSKAAIATTLLDHSLARVVPPVRALAAEGGPAGPRLYAYVHFDTQFLATSPYNLGGLYTTDDLLKSEEFAPWGEMRDELHAAIADIVRQGIAQEEFVMLDPDFAQQVVSSLNYITIRSHYGESPAWAAQFADDVATFALRALLAAISRLPSVRKEGVEIADRLMKQTLGPAERVL